MIPRQPPLWPENPSKAIAMQQQLANQIITLDDFETIERIAGVDVAYDEDSDLLVAAVAILDAKTLATIQTVTYRGESNFPYIPGLFSFRELPPLIEAFKQIAEPPDLIICDAQGRAHPRRFGLACHLGLTFDLPSIGCGKKKLVGSESELGPERGAYSDLIEDGDVVGRSLRTQTNVKPVYVSIGHKISLATACEWILRLCPRYRLPETTRQADQAVRHALKALK